MQLDIETYNYDTLLYRLVVIHIDIYVCVCVCVCVCVERGGVCEIEVANPKLIIELEFSQFLSNISSF
jgi:hypothetical protein